MTLLLSGSQLPADLDGAAVMAAHVQRAEAGDRAAMKFLWSCRYDVTDKLRAARVHLAAVDHPHSIHAALDDSARAGLRDERAATVAYLEQRARDLDRVCRRLQQVFRAHEPPPAPLPAGEQFELFRSRLPRHPYCSDSLDHGLIIRTRSGALRRRYIQANPPTLRFWMPFDLDYAHGMTASEAAGLPLPNVAVGNPVNGHAHVLYGLEAPVLVSDAGRQGPMRYLAAIESAFRAALNGDIGYSGLIVKNPAHADWKTLWGPLSLYRLEDLADCVDLTRHVPKPTVKVEQYGVGRNVALFNALGPEGRWAYSAVRDYWSAGFPAWLEAVREKGLEMNGEFKVPLLPKEVGHIAKSVAKWVWARFTPASFHVFVQATHTPEAQAARARVGGIKRRERAAERAEQARTLVAQGLTQAAVAARLGVAPRTVRHLLAQPSAKSGNEPISDNSRNPGPAARPGVSRGASKGSPDHERGGADLRTPKRAAP